MIHVALLRGINLGSRRRVAMADLRSWLTDLGYENVRTLLQSGNAVFETGRKPATVRRELESALAEGAGFTVDCVLRTGPELRAVVEADPFRDVVTDPTRYAVSFLDGPGDWPEIDPAEYEPELVHLAEREAYFWLPGGFQKSRLMAAFPTRKGQVATVRNWNTVTKLLAMAEA
ncbi:DUF1697 domain-containing protein [Actinophytocola oryzae]|uniref:Uncharacterized protein (DUF1697 family) n=1 Tax=Actinophytocola oryzae TaxID=502181 RepID=A0A4R7VVN8_9PSEU|nr:DUF1697 domain-containing protein [Actinophytocola oryzae]TDV53695.1 uncharacterized protein (DUF1697 family) [Actinophytocola oryzae]